DRHGGNHLHVDPGLPTFLDAELGVVAVLPDLTEEDVILVYAMAAVSVDHDGKTRIAMLLRQIRPFRRQDVRMDVDLQHAVSIARGFRPRARPRRLTPLAAPCARSSRRCAL